MIVGFKSLIATKASLPLMDQKPKWFHKISRLQCRTFKKRDHRACKVEVRHLLYTRWTKRKRELHHLISTKMSPIYFGPKDSSKHYSKSWQHNSNLSWQIIYNLCFWNMKYTYLCLSYQTAIFPEIIRNPSPYNFCSKLMEKCIKEHLISCL